jgi:hypothetical protein
MPSITPDDAARSLGEIEEIGGRSSRAYRYQAYSRYLILWGAVWIAGQGASLAWPGEATYVWWALVAAAAALTCVLPRRPRPANWRVPALVLIALGFVAALHLVLGRAHPDLDAAVPSLVVAAIYIGMGLWLGLRFTVAGLALAAFVLAGELLLGADSRTWMGFVDGGTLVLAGLWLRTI